MCAGTLQAICWESSVHAVCFTGPLALAFQSARAFGLHHAHAGATEIHSDRPDRQRPAREGADRHRQDRRVRPADDRSPAHPGGAAAGTRKPRGLVLVPTRELALQVHKSLSTYGVPANLRVTAIFGGVSIVPQKKELLRGTDIIVATPGRLARSHGAAHGRSVRRADPDARRSRSHARHGLHAAAAPHPEGAAARSADAAVLGDDLRRSGAAGGGLHARRRSASTCPKDRRWPRP